MKNGQLLLLYFNYCKKDISSGCVNSFEICKTIRQTILEKNGRKKVVETYSFIRKFIESRKKIGIILDTRNMRNTPQIPN